MKIQNKIIAITIVPVILLGLIVTWIILVPVHKTLQNEMKNTLKATANATLSAYEQNSSIDYEIKKQGYMERNL